MIKKIFSFLIFTMSCFLLTACQKSKDLKLYNWGEYLAPELKTKFTKETKIKVTEIKFDSNENALASIKGRSSYDIVVPSEYAINDLKNLKINDIPLIKKLDWGKIEYDRKNHFDEKLLEVLEIFKNKKGYDILDYAIPYFWGDFGILYNPEKISKEKVAELEWGVLKETKAKNGEKLKVAIYDSAADLFTVALKMNHKTVADASKEDIEKAKEWLLSIPKENRNFITDEIFDDMVNGVYDVALAYSGDAAYIKDLLEESKAKFSLDYFSPKKYGTNVWFDGMVLTSKADEELAYPFFNFMINEENAFTNADEQGYASPVKNALKLQKEEATDDIKEILEIEIGPNDELQIYDPEIKKMVEFEWTVFRCS